MIDPAHLFKQFIQSETPAERAVFLEQLNANGYTHLRYLVDELTGSIRQAEDADFFKIEEWIHKAQEYIPEPSRISPYYQSVWEQLAKILNFKREMYGKLPKDSRSGEWQIVYNNPNSNEDVLCIPSLPFHEASYMFAKYRLDLKPAEVLRLQKVADQFTITGEQE